MFPLSLPVPDSKLLLTPTLRLDLLVLGCSITLALMLWLYRYELKLIALAPATALLLLRLTVMVVLLALVCLKPVYAHEVTRQLPGKVLVAVDRSDSMDVADPQRPPADKLRLAKALRLADGLCSDAQLDEWAQGHKQKDGPRWVRPDELRDDPAGRRSLEAERRQLHDAVCARVDALTRTKATERILSPEGLGLLAALAERHEVELIGFHRDTWDVRPERPGAFPLTDLFRKSEAPPEKKEAAPAPGPVTPDPSREAGASSFTDLRLPLVRAMERSGPGQGKVLGVILLTDGQHNSGEPPSRKARELGERGVPVYPVALGARTPPPDVAVVSVRGPNHNLFRGVDAEVKVNFKITGLAAQDFIVELHRDAGVGKERKLLDRQTIRHEGKDRIYSHAFRVPMEKLGTQTFVATVRPALPDVRETRTDNNSGMATVRVVDDKARVLLVDGEARWEYHYLATALQRDKTIDLSCVVFDQPRLDKHLSPAELDQLGSPRQQWPTGPDALANFQCIILGDVDEARLPLAERERLEKYVSEAGGTLVILAGKRSMPWGFPTTLPGGALDPLRRLLPIEAPAPLALDDGFALTLTHAGREMRFMELAQNNREETEALWAGRPRPWGWGVAGRAKPGATSLAYVAEPGDERRPLTERERNNVVIARHNYGMGRVLFVGLDSTWRWRYKVGDAHHHRFWGEAIRWAAADKPTAVGNEFLRFGTSQPVYRQGEKIEVVTRFSEALGPVRPDLLAGARVWRLPDRPGEPERPVALVPLARRSAQPRVLEGPLSGLPPGRYAIELAIPDLTDKLLAPPAEGRARRPLRAELTVLPPDTSEMVDLETRWPLLEDLAVQSGGRVYTPEDVTELVGKLVAQSVPHVEHREQRLYQWESKGGLVQPAGMLLLLVVGLLTLEWVGRKWAGLP